MLGLWLEDGELTWRDDLPEPEPGPGEALIRVERAGICNTDLELLRGYYPFSGIPGHEFVGRVVSGGGDLDGRRVVGEINASCGHCGRCERGMPNHCASRTVLGIVGRDGAFAELLTLPRGNLHAVPDAVSDDAAVFVEPLAAALRIGEQLDLDSHPAAIVVGDGKLGQLVSRALLASGRDVTVIGRHADKLALLEGRGAHVVSDDRADAELREHSFDLAVECTGNPGGFTSALRRLRPRGTLVLKSTYAGALTTDASALVVDEITVIGSRCGPFEPALQLLASGRVTVSDLVSDRLPLHRGVEAFDRARRPGMLKILLDVDDAAGRS